MTAAELANLGYQPGTSPGINSDSGPIDPMSLEEMNYGKPQLSSDPNGLIPATQSVPSPQISASDLGNPGGPGTDSGQGSTAVTDNPATNPYTPGGAADQSEGSGNDSTSMPPQASAQQAQPSQLAQPKLTDWQQYLSDRGIGPNSVVDLASHRELLKGFNEIQKLKIQASLKQQDPEYLLGLRQKQQAVEANNPAALAAEQNSGAQAKQAAQFDTIAKDQATVQDTQRLLGQITTLANDKNLSSALGLSSVLPIVPGSARAGVQAKIDQLGGQAFLEAIPYLKGIGRITEMEAKNGTDAIARIKNTKQSPADYQQALSDFAAVVKTAQDRSQAAMLRNPAYPQYLASQKAIASTGQGSAPSPVTGSASASGTGTSLPQTVTIPANSSTGIPAGTYRVNANGKYVRVQ